MFRDWWRLRPTPLSGKDDAQARVDGLAVGGWRGGKRGRPARRRASDVRGSRLAAGAVAGMPRSARATRIPRKAGGRRCAACTSATRTPPACRWRARCRRTPTFVLVDRGREVGRIVGYPGSDFFYPQGRRAPEPACRRPPPVAANGRPGAALDHVRRRRVPLAIISYRRIPRQAVARPSLGGIANCIRPSSRRRRAKPDGVPGGAGLSRHVSSDLHRPSRTRGTVGVCRSKPLAAQGASVQGGAGPSLGSRSWAATTSRRPSRP